MTFLRLLIAFCFLAGIGWVAWEPSAPPERMMGSYVTSLKGRTSNQKKNALLAARRVDGAVLESGATFSFNRAVGPWSPDRGYVMAPVSYDGTLVADWGGGVCQTSTTLYNAALLAGLDIVERKRHTWGPRYVMPGRDAAVAQGQIDLKLRNPYPWPVRIRLTAKETDLRFDVVGRDAGPMAEVRVERTAPVEPSEIHRAASFVSPGGRRLMTHGRLGTRVAVWRTFQKGPKAGRWELVSQDSYPAMNRVVAVGAP